MKLKGIFFNTLIFVGCMVLAIDATSVALRSQHIIDMGLLWRSQHTAAQITLDKSCGKEPQIKDIKQAQDPGLQRLAEYQDICQSGSIRTMMLFTDMPKDSIEAAAKAKTMATTLKEYDHYGVRPLVVVEPVASWGFVDFAEFRDGFYDQWIRDYFTALKAEGITDKQMGVWVPFPEANLPYWNHQSAKPEDFGLVVNKYVHMMKDRFPGAHASILLNSASYENSDFDWSNEEYVSLLPYVRKIDKGLLDSFGMQGFPWVPRAGSDGASHFDARQFLNADLLSEAANYLGVDQVWYNTGTFMQKYTLDEKTMVTVSPETRKAILGSVQQQVLALQRSGFKVSVNIFAEDKSGASEETNWSYWERGQQRTSQHALVFHDFVATMEQAGVDVWLFDR